MNTGGREHGHPTARTNSTAVRDRRLRPIRWISVVSHLTGREIGRPAHPEILSGHRLAVGKVVLTVCAGATS